MEELVLVIAGLAVSVALGVPLANLLMKGFISFHKERANV